MHAVDLFDLGARNFPDRIAFSGAGGDITYSQAQTDSNRIARALLANGFGIGTRMAVVSPNNTTAMPALLGALRAGCAWCNVNMRAALDSNVDVLKRGRCELLLIHSSVAEMAPAFEGAIPELKLVLCNDSAHTRYPFILDWAADQPDGFLDHRVPSGSLGLQGSTGGTTGAPKITQSSKEFIVMSMLAWQACWHFDEPPVNVAIAPITHAGGTVALAHFAFGGATIMMDAPDLDLLLELIATRRVTTLFLPPTLIYLLLAHPKLAETDTTSLRYLISAAAPIAPEKLVEGVEKLGPVMCQAYGQTEAGFPLTFISPSEIARAAAGETNRGLLASCGRPTTICSAFEAMGDDGAILPPGETGELVVRGPTMMERYLDDPEATAEMQKGGWHHTGDIGYRDADGYVYVTDRLRDMITSGGFNIFPFEIEQVLIAHPAVQDCAVIGVPDPKWGEAVKACVQLKMGATASENELINTCKSTLGSMKAPKSVDFIVDLPRSPVGKVLKRELRAPYWADRDRQVN